MIYESLSVLTAIALLALMGIGPALVMLPIQSKQLQYALAVAPMLGFVMLEIIGLPLVRYLAPVQHWALLITILLVGISGALVWFWWHSHRNENPFHLGTKALVLPAVVFLICFVVLVSPMIALGIRYSIFRSNPSDAFTYISLADSVRLAPWSALVNAIRFSSENHQALERLASISPGALLTARMVGLPIQLSNMVTLAWFSQITGLPTYTAYYPYHVMAFLNAYLLGVAWGAVLGLRRIKYAAAAVIALGFWARFVLETDASFEINTIPLMLLTTFAWVQLEVHASKNLVSPVRVLFALALTALLCNYLVFPGLIVVALALFYAVALLRRERPFAPLLYHAATALLVLTFLTVTGQLDMQLLSLAYLVGAIELQRTFEPTVWNLWRANGLSAVWGMGTESLLGAQRALVRLPLAILSNFYALFLSAILILAGWIAFFRSRRIAEQILFAVLTAGLVLAAWSFVGDNLRASGKAFSYIYPYVILGVAVAAGSIGTMAPRFERPVYAGVTLWFVIQFILGAALPFTGAFSRVFSYSKRAEAYDLTPITRVLDSNPPALLYVAVPRTSGWEFAYYTSLVLGRYPAHFSGGLVMDNSMAVRNFWQSEPNTAPDYAVVLKSADIIGSAQLGERLAETRDLVLYRLRSNALNALQAQENVLRTDDSSRRPFEHAMPLRFGVRQEPNR